MKKLIAANWKMNKSVEESVSFINEFKKIIKNEKNAKEKSYESSKAIPLQTKVCKSILA